MTTRIYDLAKMMHETYEEAAVKTGWETQEVCQVKFNDLPEANREIMYILAEAVLIRLSKEIGPYVWSSNFVPA